MIETGTHDMRGYFGIGVQEISKEQNVGTLVRTAHSFGASFFFTISPSVDIRAMRQTDTSGAFDHLPYYQYSTMGELALPKACQLVGVELVENSVALPSFRHPTRAAYILGPEMGSLSPALLERCDHVIKIPMKFCVNVGVAGALVMYDRLLSQGRFAPRPVAAGGPTIQPPKESHGPRRFSRTERAKAAAEKEAAKKEKAAISEK